MAHPVEMFHSVSTKTQELFCRPIKTNAYDYLVNHLKIKLLGKVVASLTNFAA